MRQSGRPVFIGSSHPKLRPYDGGDCGFCGSRRGYPGSGSTGSRHRRRPPLTILPRSAPIRCWASAGRRDRAGRSRCCSISATEDTRKSRPANIQDLEASLCSAAAISASIRVRIGRFGIQILMVLSPPGSRGPKRFRMRKGLGPGHANRAQRWRFRMLFRIPDLSHHGFPTTDPRPADPGPSAPSDFAYSFNHLARCACGLAERAPWCCPCPLAF